VSLIHLFFLTHLAFAAPRTVMVQMFEWPWQDIAKECEQYLGPQGFSAVQVSPPQEHISLGQNTWWERYQPVSYKLISRSGTEAEFSDMVNRCHQSGIDIYVDVVFNHMSAKSDGVGFGGSSFTKYNYPGLYSPADFHYCGRNGNNELHNFKDRYELQFCELLGLADLKTESEYVRNTIVDYLNHLLDLGVAGFRIDSAKHIPAEDISAIVSRLSRKPFIVSETFIGPDEPVSLSEYMSFGNVNLFQYPFDMGSDFNASTISGWPETVLNYPDSRKVVVFSENHDLQRSTQAHLPSYSNDPTVYLMEQILLLTWPYGYPQVFSGYHFNSYDDGPPVDQNRKTLSVFDDQGNCKEPWNCEHRLAAIAALVQFHNETDSRFYVSKLWRGTAGQLAFSRGELGFVALNRDAQRLQTSLPTDLTDGWYCNLLTATNADPSLCQTYVQVQNGQALIRLAPNSALILLASAKKDVL